MDLGIRDYENVGRVHLPHWSTQPTYSFDNLDFPSDMPFSATDNPDTSVNHPDDDPQKSPPGHVRRMLSSNDRMLRFHFFH